MPVDPKLANEIIDEAGSFAPEAAPTAPMKTGERAQTGQFGERVAEFGKETAAAASVGFSRGADFIKAAIAGTFMPFIPERGTPAGEAAWKVLRPSEDIFSQETIKRADQPTTFGGKVLNPATMGVGGMASMPMGGGIARNIIAGIGMGEGSEIGKDALGRLFNYFGGPSARAIGETTGSVLGGGIGAQANVTRMRGMAEAVRQPFEAVKNVVPAYKAAQAAKQAGDERGLWSIFADEFGNLRATTRGVIQNFTNASVASAIRKDIYASTAAEQFVKDAAVTGIDERPWGLGERTMVPAITRMVKERVPASFGEASEMSSAAEQRQQSIVNAYNRMQGDKLPATAQGAEAAGQVFQKITQAKLYALSAEQGAVKQKFPDLNPRNEFAIGEKVRGVRDRLNQESLTVAKGKYAEAESMFDAEGAQIPLGDVRGKAQDILQEFTAQATGEVPPVVRRLLMATGEEEGQISSVSLKDANDLARSLNRMASDYKQAERFQDFTKAKSLEQQLLKSIDQANVSPEAKSAYAEARRYWAEEHAPRFMEGLGKALGRERGGVMEGREAVTSEKVMQKFLADKETGMLEYDRIFGRDPEARTALRAAVEGQFRSDVLNTAKNMEGLQNSLYKFKRDNAAVLERFPEVADKIDQQGARYLSLMKEKERELTRYKDIMRSDVTTAIGPIQAKAFYQNVLSDPTKMDALLKAMPKDRGDAAANMVKEVFLQANPMKDGAYNPEALYQLIKVGKDSPAARSSMEKLFTAAFGPEVGKRHMDTLEAIANFALREGATNPANIRPAGLISEAPVKEASGQTMASWISAWRAQEMGVTGSTYFTTLGLSRFANAKVQQAVESAKMKALYDPDTARAILEMAATPSTEPLGMTTARKIWGDIRLPNGQKIVDHLIDKGYVKAYVSRGMIYGLEQSEAEQRRKAQ